MLTVLLLAGAEKLINFAIQSDEITKSGLEPLAGKVLRLNMQLPELQLDVLFNQDHIRFEPVTTPSVFETKAQSEDSDRQNAYLAANRIGYSQPDCTISVANPAELLNLIRGAEGNLPIDGDYKILMQIKQLVAGFDPDIAGQLEPIIGKPLASQLQLVITQLKGNLRQTAKRTFYEVSDWANDVAGAGAPDPSDQSEADKLKQQLLRLRADVEREEARLALIKAKQAELNPHQP